MIKPKINLLIAGENLLGIKKIMNILEKSKDLQISGKLTDEKRLQESIRSIESPIVLYHSLDFKEALNSIDSIGTLDRNCKFIIIGSIGTITEIISGIRNGIRAWIGENTCKKYLIPVIKSIYNGGFAIVTDDAHNLINVETVKNHYNMTSNIRTDLTDREIEVLTLIAEGASNKMIADILYISENTAKTHVRNILEKLQIRSRMQAALFAIEKGYKK
jgi:two-component system NarL family response regulator